jgi:hypothetical protein
VTIYRNDSQTPVVYDNVKHEWSDGRVYVVSQYTHTPDQKTHHYWKWPWARISHVKVERQGHGT